MVVDEATVKWVKRRLEDVVEGMDVEVVASLLVSQSSGKELREEAMAMLVEPGGPGYHRRRVEKAVEEIVARVFPRRREKRPAGRGSGASPTSGPANCLECGFVNAVPMGEGDFCESYAAFEARIRSTRQRWPDCAACGASLREQLRHGDGGGDEDVGRAVATAARLVAYDRQVAERTKVVDDQADWYRSSTTYVKPTFTIDFAGRKVIATADEEEEDAALWRGVATPLESWDGVQETKGEIFQDTAARDTLRRRDTLETQSVFSPALGAPKEDALVDVDAVFRRLAENSEPVVLKPGLVLFKAGLAPKVQAAVVDILVAAAESHWRTPAYANGARLHCKTACFGMRWDPDTNAYLRDDVPAVPETLARLASACARAAGLADPALAEPARGFTPDLLLANFYTHQGTMGMHRDDAESRKSLDAGLPVVSLSLGADADFAFAMRRPNNGHTNHDALLQNNNTSSKLLDSVTLASGDVLLFGGPARLVYHGITSIHRPRPNSSKLSMLNLKPGRLNLTFRTF